MRKQRLFRFWRLWFLIWADDQPDKDDPLGIFQRAGASFGVRLWRNKL